VYFRKEGRALGEVTKFLVYNARKRQAGGDSAAQYFARTECVAGVQDMRFQELMPDVLHWLGVKKIHRLVSMSNMKYDAIVRAGIEVGERVRIPDELIPADARVEMDAKMAAGYFTRRQDPHRKSSCCQGRGLWDARTRCGPPLTSTAHPAGRARASIFHDDRAAGWRLPPTTYTGSCQCGANRYTVEATSRSRSSHATARCAAAAARCSRSCRPTSSSSRKARTR
jgi:hypothetical protein